MFLAISKRLRPSFTRFFSVSAAQNPDLKTPHFNVVDYLVNTCAVSPERAARICKRIARLKSPQNPDAVRRFFEHQGFAEVEINKLITVVPNLLCCSEKSLDTNLRALRDIGLAPSALTQIILSGPAALQLRFTVARIQYWRDFLGGGEAALVKLFKHNRGLVSHDIARIILPKLTLLQSNGLSSQDIQRIVRDIPMFITSSTSSIQNLLNRTKELGFQPESKKFVYGLHAMARISQELLDRKMELFKSMGLSKDNFLSALHTSPNIVTLSESNLRKKMSFLLREVSCDPLYIASNSVLLTYNLEKRLRPRRHVLHLLESKGLSGKMQSFMKAIIVSDNKFVETYILPHKEKIPGLHEDYLATCASESAKTIWKVEI